MYNKDKIMRKLLGKGPVEASPSSSVDQPHAAASSSSLGVNLTTSTSTSAPLAATLRPQGSQDASFDADSPIDCLDQSPDGHSAILAGRHILKIVSLNGASIKPGIDLRAAILAQPTVKNSTVSVSDQLSIKDVKWLKGRGDTTIFTACANGKIFQYDLTRLGGGADGAPMEVIHMREDSRQINVLDINPRSSRMLAGSQDGIVRCFDIMNPVRTHTGHLTFRAIQSFKCNAGGIQCLQWSPNIEGAFYFACGTEQGVVLKWDIRKSTAPVLRISAHDKACTSLAWHADGDHLVSGGWDKKCHVWDVSATAEKRQKPKCTISTPAAVADVAWRPATWSATAQGRRAAQLAVTYDESSRQGLNACHIWDLARPTMPFKKVYNFDQPPSALLWHDQDLLWTVGHDGLFNQFDIAYAPRMVDQIPTSVVAFSSRGEAMALLDERPVVRRPHRSVVPPDMLPPSYNSSPSTPMLGSSRSDSEDEVAGSFLGAHRVRPKHRRAATTTSRSAQTLSTTPPGGPDSPILALDQSLRVTGLYRSQQAMTAGRLLGAAKVPVYEHLSTHYLETLRDILPYKKGAPSLQERALFIMHRYAKAAETIGLFRLAQVWRLLAHAVKLVLIRRAQYHLDRRSGELERSEKARRKLKSQASDADRPASVQPDDDRSGGLNPSTSVDKAGMLRSLLAEEFESTSNVPTPVARPADGSDVPAEFDLSQSGHRFEYGKKLTPVQEGQSFTLPPPLQRRPLPRKRLDSEPLSTYSNDSDAYASTEGYDFYDTETISKAIDVPTSNDHGGSTVDSDSPNSTRRRISGHDSEESFGQIFSISSSSRQTTQLTGSSASSVRRRPLRSSAQAQPQLARSTSTGEFESRIRGTKLTDHETPDLPHTVSAPSGIEQMATTQSTEEDYLMPTQTTMDSVDSQKGEMHPKPDDFPRDTPQTVSVGASPYNSFEFKYDDLEQPQEADYLPWSDDPPYPHPIAWEEEKPFSPLNPLDPSKVVSWALQFETRSSALNASAMIMLLRPLLRDDAVIDPFLAAATIKQHHSRLMGMKLFTQAAMLRNLSVKGWPGEPLLEWGDDYTAVLRAAQHNNTVAMKCSTCHKPREIDRRRNDKQPNPVWQCERCAAVMAPCAVCLHRDNAEPAAAIEISPDSFRSADTSDEALMSLWWYCPGCGHGGHASCLQGWHAETASEDSGSSVDGHSQPGLFSDGCCPLDGCGHACLPGKYRAETTVARTEEIGRAVREVNRRAAGNGRDGLGGVPNPRFQVGRYSTGALSELDSQRAGKISREGSVYGDNNDIPQSRAVESARESLAAGGGLRHVSSAIHLGSDRGGLLSSSPGKDGSGMDGNRERERRRSVRFGASTVLEENAAAKRK
ncbi:SEA (Seh1-associated) complex subunit [Gnomoniopsis sp. IMI 355080]|nr:SEA (Seh1-associated) complex subunit [Gnomoniopsis sp. IMI 355080]